eukprot:1461618-Alexandrium_andersonii.AAC.1
MLHKGVLGCPPECDCRRKAGQCEDATHIGELPAWLHSVAGAQMELGDVGRQTEPLVAPRPLVEAELGDEAGVTVGVQSNLHLAPVARRSVLLVAVDMPRAPQWAQAGSLVELIPASIAEHTGSKC